MMVNKHRVQLLSALVTTLVVVTGCSMVHPDQRSYADSYSVNTLTAVAETLAVESNDDAADDPAIWVHPTKPGQSLILGTDKRAGIGVYRLDGSLVQFLEMGQPNNIDVRQQVIVDGKTIDVAAFTNRSNDSVGFASVSATGLTDLGSYQVGYEPYGFCLGSKGDELHAFVTYKSGAIEAYAVRSIEPVRIEKVGSYKFATQLEGCVYDDHDNTLFVGEEARGIWGFERWTTEFQPPRLIDEVGSSTGIVADVEGLALYQDASSSNNFLIVSSQGNDSYAVYDRDSDYRFVSRFRVVTDVNIDGAQETDGIEATARYLGPNYPNGVFVVQDGYNSGDSTRQNFKFVLPEFAK